MEVEIDDEDLQRALELSMQPASLPNIRPKDDAAAAHKPGDAAIVDLTEDSFTADSVAKNTKLTPLSSERVTDRDDISADQRPKSDSATKPASTVPSLSTLDRKAMEQERLARTKSKLKAPTSMPASKREASISPPPARTTYGRENKRRRVEERSSNNSGKEVVNLEAHTSSAPSTSFQPLPSSLPWSAPSSHHSTSEPIYTSGVVKKTWANGFARNNDIKIEEVFQIDQLKLAVLSSFQWDIDWLMSKLGPDTNVYLVMGAKDPRHQEKWKYEASDLLNVKLCFPPMEPQVNCMHSKLMLLSFPNYMRVVIPSANLVRYDWGETGIMENTVFMIDLPRRKEPSSEAELGAFGLELLYFLKAQNLHEPVLRGMYKFDYSNTKHLAFVHTM